MKSIYIVLLALVFIGCKSRKDRAMDYYCQSNESFLEVDSALALVNKAIELDSTNEYFYFKKIDLFVNKNMLDSVIATYNKYTKYNNTNYTATMGVGCIYELRGELDSAYKYYNKSLIQFESFPRDTSDIYTLLGRKQIEYFLYDSINLDDVKRLAHARSDSLYLLEYAIPILDTLTRQELLYKLFVEDKE